MNKSPSEWTALGDPYDCTGHLCQLHDREPIDDPWPMYSYDRPAYLLWNAIAATLHARGWSDNKIKDWLQSKETRWALDGNLGEEIVNLGKRWAKEFIP